MHEFLRYAYEKDHMKPESRSVSLVELIVVILIIGVAATITFSAGYRGLIEKQRGLEGVSNLQLIYNAEKRYHMDQGSYFQCESCTPALISKNLGVLVTTNYFDYSIKTFGTAGVAGFQASATRKEGICNAKKMYLNESSSQVEKKECAAWN